MSRERILPLFAKEGVGGSSEYRSCEIKIMKKRVVITGVGVLAANGTGKDEFWAALKEGKTGHAPVTLFDASEFNTNIAAEVKDFDASILMGKKGLRLLDRATRLMIVAGRMAVQDSKFQITDENSDRLGVSVGTTFGSLKSIAEYDEVTLREGPRAPNPALFPNTVINSPSSQISIWENIQGFNSTISTGFTSSFDAFEYGIDFIDDEDSDIVYVGSVEEMCWHSFMGFHALKFLSGSDGKPFVNCPFDRRRNGILFGEGAVILAFEELEHAKARGAKIYAEAKSLGYAFDPFRMGKYNPKATGMIEAMQNAIDNAGLGINDIDCILANANSVKSADVVETRAIKAVFGERAYKIPIPAIKSMVGETYSLCGAMAAAAAVGMIEHDFIPPTVNYQEKDPDCDLDYVPNQSRSARLNNILINTFSPTGNQHCMVMSRYQE